MEPLVSIVTVCFNSELFIRDCIASVVSQSYSNIQYIVIDGLSSDRTISILQSERSNIDILISEPDNGIYDAMNKGISLASGTIIAFLNSDDFYSDPDVISKVVSIFQETHCDCVYGDLCYIDQLNPTIIRRYWRSSIYSPHRFNRGWAPPHPCFFVKSDVFQAFGSFNTNYFLAADFDLMYRFLAVHQISCSYLDEVLVYMRLGGVTNCSLTNIFAQNREILQILRQYNSSINPFVFILSKLFARALQFIRSFFHLL